MIKKEFEEETKLFNDAQAYLESTRCLMCEDAPCEQGCPAHVPVKKFIRAIRFNSNRRSINLIREANIFAGVCGTICPIDSLCESKCTNNDLAYPIKISALQRYVAEKDFNAIFRSIPKPSINKNKKVAVIGAGPAGLAAAYYLTLHGIDVTVFEKNNKPGGLLNFGIPHYRLSQKLVENEINFITKEVGVKVETNKSLGVDFSINDLFNQGFQSVFIGVGLSDSIGMNIPGKKLDGVIPAIKFLRDAVINPENIKIGKNIAVIGGGSVAMDAAITCHKLGANVTILYRRRIKDMPASKFEIEAAINLGIQINTKSLPIEYMGEDNKLKKIKVTRIRGDFESRKLKNIPDSEYIIEADIVIEAIGQTPDNNIKGSLKDFENVNGKLIVNDKFETSVKNVYAAGDIVKGGGGTVVESVAEAKKAAEYIASNLL